VINVFSLLRFSELVWKVFGLENHKSLLRPLSLEGLQAQSCR